MSEQKDAKKRGDLEDMSKLASDPRLCGKGWFRILSISYRDHCSLASERDYLQDLGPNGAYAKDPDFKQGWCGTDRWDTEYKHLNRDNVVHWCLVIQREIKQGVQGVVFNAVILDMKMFLGDEAFLTMLLALLKLSFRKSPTPLLNGDNLGILSVLTSAMGINKIGAEYSDLERTLMSIVA